MKRLLLIFCFVSMLGVPKAQESALILSLKDAEQLFLERNLSLIAGRYDINIAQAQILQAKLFDNPVISLEQNIYNRLNGKYFDVGKEGEAGVEIEQVINIAGQRNKRIRLEKVNKEIAEYQFEEVVRTLRSELNEKFIQVYFSSKSLVIYDKEIDSLELLLRALHEQHQKGNISLMERTRLESLLLSLRKEKNELERSITSLKGDLNLLLNLPPEYTFDLIFDDTVLKQTDLMAIPFPEMKSMLFQRPDLRIAHAGVSASKANLRLQKSMAAPEFSIKGIYDRVGNFIENYFAIGVTLSVPVFNRNQGGIKSAHIEVLKSNKEEEYAIEKACNELFMAYAWLQGAVELNQHINDEMEQKFELLITGVNENYFKRNISMLEFIDYYESYKEACLQMYETKKNVFLAMENMNTVVGQNIFDY